MRKPTYTAISAAFNYVTPARHAANMGMETAFKLPFGKSTT